MTEQQRQAAWEAVHRPETTGEELARIAEAHPEFASAIAAHPNAPATQPAEQAPHEQAERMQQCAPRRQRMPAGGRGRYNGIQGRRAGGRRVGHGVPWVGEVTGS